MRRTCNADKWVGFLHSALIMRGGGNGKPEGLITLRFEFNSRSRIVDEALVRIQSALETGW